MWLNAKNLVLNGAALLLLVLALCAEARAQSEQLKLAISWEPDVMVNGSPSLFFIKASAKLQSLTGLWFERPIYFDFDAQSGLWYGLAGVGVDAAPGSHQLLLEAVLPNGEKLAASQPVMIGKGLYRTVTLRVARKFTSPDAATLARVKQEQALKAEVFKRLSPARTWAGPFLPPLNTVTTEEYGVQRTFNNVRQSIHQGLDYRAATGTPIAAMNSGTVVLARNLFYEGNCVMIDHGRGLLTLYLHLSEMQVAEGSSIKRGQIIGLSGATGRVTGPHLHVAVRWQGLYVDPATLLELPLP